MGVSKRIFCKIRGEWVTASPEEMIRQQLIQKMVHSLGYPIHSLILEKGIKHIPHSRYLPIDFPKRRVDLIVMTRHSLSDPYPLLLIECKAVKLNSKMIRQVIGYNLYLKAPFIALVNQAEAQFGWYNQEQELFTFQTGFPSYQKLLKNLKPTEIMGTQVT
jgi:hypothetical protein